MVKRKGFRRFLIVLLIVALSFSFAHFVEARNWKDSLRSALELIGEGMSEEKKAEVEQYLLVALDSALGAESWDGMVRVGYGFVAMGKSEKAINTFRTALDLARNRDSWEGVVRVGQAFATLRNYSKAAYSAALNTIREAEKMSKKQGSWEGLVRVGRVFSMLDNQKEAERLYRVAKSVAGKKEWDRLGKEIRFFSDTLLIQSVGRLEPGLADSWKIFDEGRTINISLRKEIECFNGDLITTDSVINSLGERSLEIQKLDKIDDFRVEITSSSDNLKYLLISLTYPEASIECRDTKQD